MKILLLTEFFPAVGQEGITGGVEARCFFVQKYLSQTGHKIKVLSAAATENSYQASPKLSSFPRQMFFFVRLLLKGTLENFDLIEGTNFTTYVAAWIVGRIKRKPVVYWYPDVFIGFWRKNAGTFGYLGEWLERVILKFPADCYIAISHSTKRKLIAQHIPSKKIVVIPCGVDQEEIEKTKNNPAQKKFDLCAVSRLVVYKKIDDLVKAVGLLKKNHQKVTLAIIGQGPEETKLQGLARNLGLSRQVFFLGHLISHSAVEEVVAAAKIFCHPSVIEGFGIVLIEAAALGIPYAASDIEVVKEITKNGQGGLLFKHEDPYDLARSINLLLSDKKLYRRKSTEGKKLAREYTWEKIAQQTLKVYENLHSH